MLLSVAPPWCYVVLLSAMLPRQYGHFDDTQQSDASNSKEATGSNQPAQQKDKKVAQHERQCKNSNATVAAMVTAMAVSMMATTGVVHTNVGQNVTPHNHNPSLGLCLYHFLNTMSL